MKEDKEKKDKIQECEQKIEELENNWKRALADYRNLEKRVDEEKDSWRQFSNETLIRQILPVADNLETLLKHVQDKGLHLIVKELQTVLTGSGVEPIESENTEFDPIIMEAVETVPGEKNKVVETVLKGYLLKNKLIRPARVKVGNGEEPENKEEK